MATVWYEDITSWRNCQTRRGDGFKVDARYRPLRRYARFAEASQSGGTRAPARERRTMALRLLLNNGISEMRFQVSRA